MADAGLSTLGIKVWQAQTENSAKVTEASSYSQLTRINSIGEVTITPETIDASALEDLDSRFVAGKSTVTDALTITINATNDTIAEWKAIAGKQICIMIDIPSMEDAFFVIVEVPATLPLPALDQNALLTMAVNCTVNKFIGLDEKIVIGA
jgi:hypothetical protein